MKIIVCVKQVPDTSGKVAVKADGTMDRASMATIINPDDLNAVEAALEMKDRERQRSQRFMFSISGRTASQPQSQDSRLGLPVFTAQEY